MHLNLRPHDMAHQQRLEKRACREAGQRRSHKAQHVGTVRVPSARRARGSLPLSHSRANASRFAAMAPGLTMNAGVADGPRVEMQIASSRATSAPALPATGMCDWNPSRTGGL